MEGRLPSLPQFKYKYTMKKRYEVKGMMEWHPVFKVGRSRLQVSFTGGNLCGGAHTAASFETSDPVVQKVIEDSVPFRSKRISLVYSEACDQKSETGTHGLSGSLGSLPPISDHPTPTESNIFEYSNEEDIYEYLQHTCGVSVDELSAEDSCYDVANRLGITLRKKS